MKATYGSIDVKGGVLAREDGTVLIACPGCGNCYSLRNPPFTFNRETVSIGPASIRLLDCGWHGYLTNGNWSTSTDSACGKLLVAAREEGRKVAREDLKVGQRVSFRRMANKVVSLTGTIDKLYEYGANLVEVKLDDDPNVIETAHVDDVTVLDQPKASIADLEKILNEGDGRPVTVNPDGSISPVNSLHTVNGKPI